MRFSKDLEEVFIILLVSHIEYDDVKLLITILGV
jgi:hypothetical protein